MSYPRILVVTSCTGEKCFKPENSLTLADFQDKKRLKKREDALSEYAKPAAQMYTGRQHLFVMEGVRILREALGEKIVDVAILSAGYGLISEEQAIVPYEVTFKSMRATEIDEWSKSLGIREAFEEKVRNYDLIFVLLGNDYLRALSLPIQTGHSPTFVFLASKSSNRHIHVEAGKSEILMLSNQEAKQFRCGLVALKGLIFKSFSKMGAKNPNWLKDIQSNPHQLLDFFEPEGYQLKLPIEQPQPKQSKKKASKAKFKKYAKDEFIPVPSNIPMAKNWHLGMRYFIPDWDDRVDPKYDFLTDTLTPDRDPYFDDIYAHQIYNKANYDGILISKVVVEKSKKKQVYLEEFGVHGLLNFEGDIMGDCGAFGYIKEDMPPFNTNEILDYYQRLGFDYGVSIDHLIVGDFAQPGIREKRYNLTLKNAFEFLEKHQRYGYQFTPIAAVQGWDPDSYAKAVIAVIDMGYSYIALGGLAKAPTGEILEVLKAVSPCLTSETRLHLFGVARLNAIAAFRHLGVTSFDSAAPLRNAWQDSISNYHSQNKKYASVRIPDAKASNRRVKQVIEAGVSDLETLGSLEIEAINAMRQFDLGKLSLEATLEKILAYDKLLELPRHGKVDPLKQASRIAKHESLYRDLLVDRPWKQCPCKICQEIGIEVVIFKNNNRNRRRGFHNTYVFYNEFKKIIQAIEQQYVEKKCFDKKNDRLCPINGLI